MYCNDLLDDLMQQVRERKKASACVSTYITGGKAWFSDSSDAEKQEFEHDMTFKQPAAEGEMLFCTGHGKVKAPQIRLYFSWPVRANEPVYVVYFGPKLTKR